LRDQLRVHSATREGCTDLARRTTVDKAVGVRTAHRHFPVPRRLTGPALEDYEHVATTHHDRLMLVVGVVRSGSAGLTVTQLSDPVLRYDEPALLLRFAASGLRRAEGVEPDIPPGDPLGDLVPAKVARPLVLVSLVEDTGPAARAQVTHRVPNIAMPQAACRSRGEPGANVIRIARWFARNSCNFDGVANSRSRLFRRGWGRAPSSPRRPDGAAGEVAETSGLQR
jgi:hypothetical protein